MITKLILIPGDSLPKGSDPLVLMEEAINRIIICLCRV